MGNCLEKLKRGQRGEDDNSGKNSLERRNRYQEADDDSQMDNSVPRVAVVNMKKPEMNAQFDDLEQVEEKKHSWDTEDRAAQRAAYRKLLFMNKESEFLFRTPGQLNGKDFAINNSKNCQLYVHDNIAQCFVDRCENSTIMLGPTKSSIFIRDCTNCQVAVFC